MKRNVRGTSTRTLQLVWSKNCLCVGLSSREIVVKFHRINQVQGNMESWSPLMDAK